MHKWACRGRCTVQWWLVCGPEVWRATFFIFVSWDVAVVSDRLFGCCGVVYVESSELVASVQSFRGLTINGNCLSVMIHMMCALI